MDEVVARINRGGLKVKKAGREGLIGKWWCEVIVGLGYFRRRKGWLGLTRGVPSNPIFQVCKRIKIHPHGEVTESCAIEIIVTFI